MEPIAIIGLGCRFPKAENSELFWQLLYNGEDAITEVPLARWDINEFYDPTPATKGKTNTRWGGFIDKIDRFDADFFGISPREAERIDPQQRLVLEVSWDALENAQLLPSQLSGSQTGVFLGISTRDYSKILDQNLKEINAYNGTGTASCITANRVSYLLNLKGPSLAIDTACSSSLVALHYACQSLRSRETDLCLAGGVNAILSPETTIIFSQARMMASDGHCKTFDDSADGYVRGEGCGVVVLKRLSDALKDGDTIQAIIRGSAVNQDGLTNGITAPNGLSQQAVIRQALNNAEVAPSQISYIEAHGTGTPLGDPQEFKSLKAVLMEGRRADQPCWIGSVKTNIGHLESAAGIAGLIKVVLSLQHREIPQHLHLKQLNRYISLEGTSFIIPTVHQPWESSTGKRLAGVSAFGFGGTNCHVVLEEAPIVSSQPKFSNTDCPVVDRPLHLLTLAAKTQPALFELASRYQDFLSAHPDIDLADVCFSANTTRSQFEYRLAVLANSSQHSQRQLENFRKGKEDVGVATGKAQKGKSPKIAFLFTGQGSQYVGMGQQLYETESIFRDTLNYCAEVLSTYLEKPLLEVLYPPVGVSSPIDETAYTQPAIFAIEYSLAKLWQSWGIRPNIVMGHSIGEYTAACIAGVFSLEDGLKLIAHRSRLMQQLPSGGKMVALMASAEQVREFIKDYDHQVSLAAINGPQSVVISGTAEAVTTTCQQLESQGVKSKSLQVSHAFHSPLMEPMLAEFAKVAEKISYNLPQIPLVSNVTGCQADDNIATTQYWVRHVRESVRFAESIETLHRLDCTIFLEVGPKPILLAMGCQCLPDNVGVWMPSLRPPQEDWQQMLTSLGQLYVRGAKVDWSRFDQDYHRQKVSLPTYPFQRQRYWIENGGSAHNNLLMSKEKYIHPLLGYKLQLAGLEKQQHFESQLSISEVAYLADHRVFGKPVLPATAYLEMALAAGATIFKSDSLILEDVTIYQALIFPDNKLKTVQTVLKLSDNHTCLFEIFSLDADRENQYILHASGSIRQGKLEDGVISANLSVEQKQFNEEASVNDLYQELNELGMNYGLTFQAVKKLWTSEDKTLGLIELSPDLFGEAEKYKIHPVLLDASLHSSYGRQLGIDGVNSKDIYLPIQINRLQLYHASSLKVWSYGLYKDTGNREITNLDTLLFDEEGNIVGAIEGVIGKKVNRQALLSVIQKQLPDNIHDCFYQIEWRSKNHEFQIDSGILHQKEDLSHWLIFADSTGLANALATQLKQRGHECTLVYRGKTAQNLKAGIYQIDPSHLPDFEQLIQSILDISQLPLKKVIHLWSLDNPNSQELTTTTLESSQLWGCSAVLQLIHSITKIAIVPQLWLVTRGSQAVLSETEEVTVASCPLWGFGQVVSLEYPQLWGGLIDLDPNASDSEVKILTYLLENNHSEDHLALRGKNTYVARLVKQSPKLSQPVLLDSASTYLITGGLGSLGLHIAKWMIDKGARHLVLIGRNQPLQHQQIVISDLQKLGAEVVAAQADVCRLEDLLRVFEQIDKSMKPLKGIVHAAGLGGFKLIEQMDRTVLEEVMAAKIMGGWILHQLTQHRNLDFFVSYSSISAVWGEVGQAHYGASNYFLDGLSHYRCAKGLPSFSINWGPWSGGGMASEKLLEILSQKGIDSLSPKQATSALEQLWTSGNVQTTVVNINWHLFKQIDQLKSRQLFLEEIEVKPLEIQQSAFVSKDDRLLEQLKLVSYNERGKILITYLQSQLTQVLGINNAHIEVQKSINLMGIDSLMAMELRNKVKVELEIEIAIINFLEGLSIADIAAQINEKIEISQSNTQEEWIEGEI